MRTISTRLKFGAGLTALALAAAAAPSAAGELAEELAAIRAATEKYADVNVALAEGYIPAPPGDCVTARLEGLPPELGAMGVHYINPAVMQITATDPRVYGEGLNTDFTAPSILLYEPQADGSLELVAVENLVFQKAWKAAGNDSPPVFEGQVWDTMADDPAMAGDQAHGFEPHYDLHAWAFRDNPAGPFAPFNTAVTCDNHGVGG